MATFLEDARAATDPPDLVDIVRAGLDDRRIQGFVVAVSAELLLLHSLSDRLDLDGYAAFRTKDISEFRRDFPKKRFYLKALTLKGIQPAFASPVSETPEPQNRL